MSPVISSEAKRSREISSRSVSAGASEDLPTSVETLGQRDQPAGAGFDFIAPHYRRLEGATFARALQNARIAFLDKIVAPKRALIVGEGNGRFLAALVAKHPAAKIDCVDASARMLQLARKNVPTNSNVRFLQRDALLWSPGENLYDLIVTHFFLDCFSREEIEAIVSKLACGGTDQAVWLLADFSIPSGPLRKIHARMWLWAMHRFFRVVAHISAGELIDPSPFLEAQRFRRMRRQTWRAGLVASELWERNPQFSDSSRCEGDASRALRF